MKPKRAAILRHIFDSVILIAISTIIILMVWIFLQPYLENSISWFSQVNILVFVFIIFVFPVILAWQFPKTMASIWRSIFLLPRHWGFAFRVFICSALTLGLAWKFNLIKGEYVWTILVYGIVMFLFVIVIAKFHLYLYEKAESVTIDPEKDDRPIRTLKENSIPEFENIACKILNHLKFGTKNDNHGPNVALIGPYGSGKTSLCNLIEDAYNNLPNEQKKIKIIFCRFEAWQYLTADAAVRGLIDCIVSQIKKCIDSVELSKIPEHYLDAIGTCPHWSLKIVSIFLRKHCSADEVVLSLQDILLRINRKVVVFVDDLDRLENRSTEAQEAVTAALNQLQNLTSVQYVLCVGPSATLNIDKAPRKANYDLLKSTRFQELIPDMTGKDILGRIRALKDEALSDKSIYYPWHDEEDCDIFTYNPILESFESNIASQIIKLIQTPRELKTVERETREKWKGLNGEISWNDLVMINTLKACEISIFEWIINEKQIFLDGPLGLGNPSDTQRKEARETIESQLKERLFVKTQSRFNLVSQVLLDLFHNFMRGLGSLGEDMVRGEPHSWKQRLSFNPISGTSYFERFKSGRIRDDEIPDQVILQYIRKITENRFECKEFEDRFLVTVQKLTNDINYFEQFSELLTRNCAIEICDCILNWMCDRDHWKIWDPPNQYPNAVMNDVHSILEKAGQFHIIRQLRRQQQDLEADKYFKEWIAKKLDTLIVKDVIVGIAFEYQVVRYHIDEGIIKDILNKVLKPNFLNDNEIVWKKIKGHYSYLNRVLEALKGIDGYQEIRDKVTNLIVEKTKTDESGEMEYGVIISLVSYTYPAARPDLIDQYQFILKDNNNTYNMQTLFPLIKNWKDRKFNDPVVAKAFEHLLRAIPLPIVKTENRRI